MKLHTLLIGALLLSLSSCDKCYLCYNPVEKYEQELCGTGTNIDQSIKEAEDAGWECAPREE